MQTSLKEKVKHLAVVKSVTIKESKANPGHSYLAVKLTAKGRTIFGNVSVFAFSYFLKFMQALKAKVKPEEDEKSLQRLVGRRVKITLQNEVFGTKECQRIVAWERVA
jgi:hypothetical protein